MMLSQLIKELTEYYDEMPGQDVEVKGQITAIHHSHYQILFDTIQDEVEEEK